jgi:cell division septation protein DedD
MMKKPNERWEVRLTLSQLIILIGVMTGCLAISFYLGFFSGKQVGAAGAMESSLATLPKVPITGEAAPGETTPDAAEEAVSDVYAKLKASGSNKENSLVELPMPAVEAIKEADSNVTAEGEKMLQESLEVVEPPVVGTPPAKKAAALSDPWSVEAPTAKKKTIDDVLDQSGAEKREVAAPAETPAQLLTVAPTKVPEKPTLAPTAVPTPIKPTPTPTPKMTPTPKSTPVPTKTSGAAISQGIKEKGWYAQVAAPKSKTEADALASKLRSNGFRVAIETAQVKGDQYYRILVGPEDNKDQATSLVGQLKRESYLAGEPFIRPIK